MDGHCQRSHRQPGAQLVGRVRRGVPACTQLMMPWQCVCVCVCVCACMCVYVYMCIV